VVLPLLLASGTRLAGPGQSVSAFLVFGAMSLLVLADFGGQTRSRAMAYITTTLLGVPLVVVGTPVPAGSIDRARVSPRLGGGPGPKTACSRRR
jgi:hypothetical protein